MTEVVELAALTATLAVAVGYVPQVVHTWKARCCVGISIPAWSMWAGASILFYAHAISIGDLVFISLLTVQLTAQLTIVVLATKHRGQACEAHGGHQ